MSGPTRRSEKGYRFAHAPILFAGTVRSDN